jgi:hypothetical protein
MAKIFLIGIGGTGMRCLESFVHTCAIGMYDETEVEMLALDTDKDNGNFVRLRKLVEHYNKINGGIARKDTFFSAKIKYYEFSPGYTDNDSFAVLSNYTNLDTHRNTDPSADFVDMFLSQDVRNMNLKDGYRAQTQMGSLLMYYAIEQAAYEAKKGIRSKGTNDLREFLSKLNDSNKQPVFVFGSVFGGTGASSIPIIPLAFKQADKIFERNNDVVADNYFGSIVLTNYFKFDVKGNLNEVVARSENFAINSQSALMFYNEDATVASTYKRLYLLGRQSSETRDVLDKENGGSSGVTGGKDQKNPADYIELLAAFAAYNFFKEARQPEPFKDDQGKRFLCLAHDYGTNKLDFRLFAQEDEEVFKKKLGAFTVASLLNLKGTEFFANIVNERNMFESVNANGVEMDSLREYLALYNVGLDQNDNVVRGWLPQMNAGRGGQGIFFNDALFRCETLKELNKFKYNSQLFVGDNPPKFDVGFLSNIFSTVKNKFVATDAEKRNNFDDLLSRTYSTIMNLYFND